MGLRGKLLTRILLPVTALVAMLWIHERENNRTDALEAARARLETSASTASELLEYRVNEFSTVLSGVLTQDAVAKYFGLLATDRLSQAEQMRASIENACKRLFVHTPNIQSIELFDAEGERFLAIEDRAPVRDAVNVQDRDWYREASTAPFTVFCLSGGLMRITRVEPLLQSSGPVTGSMIIDVGRIAEPIFGFANRGAKGVRSRLLCQHDQVIFGLGDGTEEGERLRKSAPQAFCDGQLIYEQAESSALADVKRSESRSLAIAVLTLTALLITVWMGLRKIVLQPASRLLDVILAFERGQDIPFEPTENGLGDELAKLDVAFRGAIECERRSSQSLIELNQSLEGRVSERTKELAQARDEALAASRAKSAFLANMSHEIRTPMNGVIGMTDLLISTELDAEQLEFADTVRSSAGSLLTVINDVLDFSKVEAGHLELEQAEFVPKTTIEEVFNLLSISAMQKGLAIRQDISDELSKTFIGDSVRLRQVITNLVSNAIKFTDGGHVTISAAIVSESESDSVLRFEIYDTGCGVSEEAQAKIFNVFSQADNSTTRKFGGTGLGLSICKSLVELMNGEIGIESEEHEYSRFWFTAHLGRKPETNQPEVDSNRAEAQNEKRDSDNLLRTTPRNLEKASETRRLLLAEDNAVNQAVATKILERMGYEVDVAVNGLEALRLLKQQEYGAVLMDCQMPEMDGYQATVNIRDGHGGRSDIPVIAMTANAMQGDRTRCMEAGMDDYLSKPIAAGQLAEKLEYWLGNRPAAKS